MREPFLKTTDTSLKPATTNYLGEIARGRLKYADGVLFFKGDAKSLGKIGMQASRARGIAGSYDALNRELTIVTFDVEPNRDANARDAVYALNDGTQPDGKRLGPFYGIGSVSPSIFLKPGQSVPHHQVVFHFIGPDKSLDPISSKLLGVSLRDIKTAIAPYPEKRAFIYKDALKSNPGQ